MAGEVLTFTRVQIADPLIPLSEVKDQLRETDPAKDAEIGRVFLIAQNEILARLKNAADPAWSIDNRPPLPIQGQMLALTTHRWVHRGDDMSPTESGATPDEAVWEAIDRALAPFRDPAYA